MYLKNNREINSEKMTITYDIQTRNVLLSSTVTQNLYSYLKVFFEMMYLCIPVTLLLQYVQFNYVTSIVKKITLLLAYFSSFSNEIFLKKVYRQTCQGDKRRLKTDPYKRALSVVRPKKPWHFTVSCIYLIWPKSG